MEITKKFFVYGASGHGRVLKEAIESAHLPFGGFIDDDPQSDAFSWDQFCTLYPQASIVLGIGSNTARSTIAQKIVDKGYDLATVIHPSAIISPSALLERGVVVMPLVVVNAHATIKQGAILNTSCVIEHDCVIGTFSHISPRVALAGNVTVGEFSHIGIGASSIQGVTIGSYVTVGAGAAIIHDLPSHTTAVGIPAKIIKGDL